MVKHLLVVGVPHWALALVLSMLSATRAAAWYRRHGGARRDGLCPGCGYDMRATPAKCPECGRAADDAPAARAV